MRYLRTNILKKTNQRVASLKHLKVTSCIALIALSMFVSIISLSAQTYDTGEPAYLELQPQFIEEADYMNIYFNAKFEDDTSEPVFGSGDNVFDHLEELNLQWNGTVIYALEHTALKNQNLGAAYTTSTFDLTRFATDTFKDYILTSIASDVTVTYTNTEAYSGKQEVVQVRVRVKKTALSDVSDPFTALTIRMYADYYDRGTSGNSLDHAGIHFSQSFPPHGPDAFDDTEETFDLEFANSGGANPSQYTASFNIKNDDGVYDYDHLDEMNLQWDGQRIFALDHTSLGDQALGASFTTRTFDEGRVGSNDTFREFVYTAIADDIAVSYDLETVSINGRDQDVIRVTVTVDREGLEEIDDDLSGKFRAYAKYYMRNEATGTNGPTDITGTGEVNLGAEFSSTYDITPVDNDTNVQNMFNLQFSNNGGSYPSSFDVSFNIIYEDFVFAYDHIEELNIQWNGSALFALEHTALKNQNLGSNYTTREFVESRVGTGDTFKEYIRTDAASSISVSYDEVTQNINGRDQQVVKVTVSLDRDALFTVDDTNLTGQLRVYSDYYLRGETTTANGAVNVGTEFSSTYTIREEVLDASEELDFNTLDFVADGYTRIGFKLSDYSGEEISDHIGCVDLWYNDGSGWKSMVNIRHNDSKFENDCSTDLSGQGQGDTFGALGRTYVFALNDEARIEAIGGKYYKGSGDVEYTSGDPYIYIRHYVDSDDFDKSIAYKLGGTYILKDFDGEKKQSLWNHPGTDASEQASIATTFDEIPNISAPGAVVSVAGCGIDVSWAEPATSGWGDDDRHQIELLRDNAVIVTLDAHDVASHSNSYLDTDIMAGVTYDYQVRLAYERSFNGSIRGDLSPATSLTTDEVEIPAGVATAQASCDGDLTISWTWPGTGNPNGYILERDEDGNGFNVLDDAIDGALLSYTDNAVLEGSLYTYRIAAFDGLCDLQGDFSPAVTNSRDTINLTSTIIRDALQTSKGYFNDRTELFWEMTGVNEQFVNQFNIYARELGSTVSPILIENLERNDRSFFHERGEANVIYEYFVTTERVIETECGFEITSSYNIGALDGLSDTYQHLPDSGVAYGIGLRNATAVVNGNVTYSGGIAVPDVKVVVERESSTLGRSVYFDGLNDYAQLDHNNVISFDTAMTLTSWVKFENLEKFAVVLEKQGSYGLHVNVDGSAYFYIKNLADGTEYNVPIPASSITSGRWMNITTTYSQATRTLKLYIDGLPFGSEVLPVSVTGIGNIGFPFTMGRQHGSQDHYFHGFIDETRLYDRALTDDEVLRESGRITKTDTEGLVAYWKIFESTGNRLYDAAHDGSFFFKNDVELHGVSWSTDIPNDAQLGVAAYTNRFGNFSIEGIPYSGSGENFRVTPTITLAGVVHEFDPSSTSVYLGDGNLVENGVDFEDISVFEVSGRIVYDFEDTEGSGTKSVGSAGVQLFLDGIIPMEDTDGNPITTGIEGNFSASIPIGLHYISFEKDNHTLSDGARWPSVGFNNFQADVSGIQLYDQTLHKFVGTVAGGTSASDNGVYSIYQINNLGESYFDITSKDNIISRRVETDSLSGIFEIELPPLEYNLSSVKWSFDNLDIVPSGNIEAVNLGSTFAYQGMYELDSTLTPILVQSYPSTTSESAIANFRVDSLTATKIHYSWTLNDPTVRTQRHIWINDTDTTEYFNDVNPSNFPTGQADSDVTFAGTNAYNVDSELPNALLLEFVNASNVTHQVGVVFNGFTAETLFKYDTSGFEYVADSIFYNARRDFIHRELPTLEVVTAGDTLFSGESTYGNVSTNDLTVDLEQLPYPTFYTNDFYQLEIRANEIYTNKDNGVASEIPVTDGNIIVNNGIGIPFVYGSDGRKEYSKGAQKSLDDEGLATYDFVGGDPSFVQITSTGQEQNSFTKTINVSLEVDGQSVTWPVDPTNNPQRAYVLGIQAIPGANFVTAAPETVEFILRDPPGSDSYAYREAGTTYSVSEEFIGSGFGGLDGSQGGGVAFEIAGGGSFGGHIEVGGQVDATAQIGIKMEIEATTGATVDRSLETTETITTNDQPVEVGASDIFVAKSHNLETGYAMRVQPLPLIECGGNCFGDIITMPNGSQFQMGVSVVSYINPEGFPTYVVYTQNHIETVLIPDIAQLRNSILTENSSYTSNIAPDHELYGTNNDDPEWGTAASTTNYTKTEAADLSGPSYTFNNGGDDTRADSVRFYNQQIRLWEEALAFNEIEKWAAFNAGNGENVSLASGLQLERSSTTTASSVSMISLETSMALSLNVDVAVAVIVAGTASLDAELGLKTTSTTTRGKETANTFGYVLQDSDENDAFSIDIAPGVGGNSPVFSTIAGQTSCPFEPGLEMKYATPEFIDKAIVDRQALIAKLTKSKNLTDILKTQVEIEITAIQDDVKDLEQDVKTYTESQIKLIKAKADITEIFDEIQSIVKGIGENAANSLVQKAVGPVVGGVNDFIGTLQDINIPVPFTRGVSPFENIPTIPQPSAPTGDFAVDFSQLEAFMLKRLKAAEEIATETINRTTELITQVQLKIKKRLLDLNNLTIRLKEFELDLASINAEIDAVNEQILQFQQLQSILQSTTEPIMLSNSTLQREKPTLLINGADEAQVYNVPAEDKANFNLLLGNESESGDAMFYNIQTITSTNPNGLVLSIDGLNIATPREFLVEGSGAIQKVLSIERGPFEYDYEDIKVLISSTCQYDPTSNTALIADTVSLDVSYLPTCTDLEIAFPEDNWVGNNLNEGVFPITISGYDINATGLENIRVQYKPREASDWTLLDTYYRDENAPGWADGAEVLPLSGNVFTYNWDISTITDGEYDIRAVSNCALAEATSNIHSGIIDKVNPQLFGAPQPADGVLSAGDELLIQFNEPINAGLLSPANFDIRGVLNGGTLRHEAAVDFNGSNSFVSIPQGVNLARKAFSIDLQVQRRGTGQEVLMAQGINAANGLTFGFNSSDQPYFNLNGEVVTATTSITDNAWHHLAIVHDFESNDALLYLDGGLIGVNNSFEADYVESGLINVGKSQAGDQFFDGYIHELRIWNKPLAVTDINKVATTRVSKTTPNLLANWEMEEAYGSIAQEKVRLLHATINASWKVFPSGESLAFDGSSFATVSSPIISQSQSFTVSFWFNSTATNSTLLSTGRGDILDSNENGWSIGLNATGQLEALNSDQTFIISDDAVNDGAWHHVALSANRLSNITGFMDGEEGNSISAESFAGFSGPKLWLGARGWIDATVEQQDQFYIGNLDEVRIWNTNRSLAQIEQDQYSKLTGDEEGLLAYFPMEAYIETGGILISQSSLENQAEVSVGEALTVNGSVMTSTLSPNIKLPRPADKVRFNYTSNGDQIILTPIEDNAKIENTILEIAVKNVQDLNGNLLQNPITWTAFVNRNQVVWLEEQLVIDKNLSESFTMETRVVNQGGSVQDFSLSNLPSWLIASPTSGTLEPLSSQVITLTINPGLNIGQYVEDIYVETSLGFRERLELEVKVTAPYPADWIVTPENFQFSMSLIAQVRLDGVLSRDPDDAVAVFVDGEIRGLAQLQYVPEFDNYQAFISIYSNQTTGEDLDLRVWNASEGRVHTNITPNYTFAVDARYGSPTAPEILEVPDFIVSEIPLIAGWQWLSFNLESADQSDVNSFLSSLTATEGDVIKSQETFDQYDPTIGWFGSLTTSGSLQNSQMYKYLSQRSDVLVQRGSIALPENHPISVQSGWNWIGFISQRNKNVNEALAGYSAQVNDEVKSQRAFAVYGGASLGWIGSLQTLVPGQGYLLNAGQPDSFTYPRESVVNGRLANSDILTLAGGYELDYSRHPDNMSLIATIESSTTDTLLVFNQNELVGLALPFSHSAFEVPIYFVTIHGTGQSGKLEFRSLSNQEVLLSPSHTVSFESDARIGTLDEPLLLSHSLKSDVEGYAEVYPNPFKNKVAFTGMLITPGQLTLQVQSISGKQLGRLSLGYHEREFRFTWDGRFGDGSHLNPGLYIARILSGDQVFSYKIIKE